MLSDMETKFEAARGLLYKSGLMIDEGAPDDELTKVSAMAKLYSRFHEPDIGLRHHRQILINRARMEGFLVSDFADRFPEGLAQPAAWHREGRLKFREDEIGRASCRDRVCPYV